MILKLPPSYRITNLADYAYYTRVTIKLLNSPPFFWPSRIYLMQSSRFCLPLSPSLSLSLSLPLYEPVYPMDINIRAICAERCLDYVAHTLAEFQRSSSATRDARRPMSGQLFRASHRKAARSLDVARCVTALLLR
jgi:hypothetical protein